MKRHEPEFVTVTISCDRCGQQMDKYQQRADNGARPEHMGGARLLIRDINGVPLADADLCPDCTHDVMVDHQPLFRVQS